MSTRERVTCPCCKAEIMISIETEAYVDSVSRADGKPPTPETEGPVGHPADAWTADALARVPPQITKPETVDALLAMEST